MSPEQIPCPKCGKMVSFHEEEMERVRTGGAVCLSCGLDLQELEFLQEVLEGQHRALIEELGERLEEERRENLW